MTGFNTINPQAKLTQQRTPIIGICYSEHFKLTEDGPVHRTSGDPLTVGQLIQTGLERTQGQINSYTRNQSGPLTTEQFKAKQGHTYADLNKDGIVDNKELTAFYFYQDTLGVFDGQTDNRDTAKALKKLDSDSIATRNEAHATLNAIYNTVKSFAENFTTPFKMVGDKFFSQETGKEVSKESLIKEGVSRSFSETKAMDNNGDFQVSAEEYQMATGFDLEGIKKSIDVNQDGIIDAQEDFNAKIFADASFGDLNGALSDSEKATLNSMLSSNDVKNGLKDFHTKLGFDNKQTNPIATGKLTSTERGNLAGTLMINGQECTIKGDELLNAKGERMANIDLMNNTNEFRIQIYPGANGTADSYKIKMDPFSKEFSLIDKDLQRLSMVDEDIFGQKAS